MEKYNCITDIVKRHLDRLELASMGPVKECVSCREWLPHDAEFFHQSGKRGLDSCCKACRYERRAA